MSRYLSHTPSKSQQEDLKVYNKVVNGAKKPAKVDEVDVDAFVEDLIIQDIQRESGHGMTNAFVKDYVMQVPSQSQIWSDTRKARLRAKHTLERGLGFNIWINEIIMKPRIFSYWFKYLPFPNDLHRSFNLLFELIYKSELSLTLHEEYIEIFKESKELRIPLSILDEDEMRVILMLKVKHSDLFKTQQMIVSGNKVVYTGFKTELIINRKLLLKRICAHFLSCSISRNQVLPILDILSNSLRYCQLYDIYEELLETDMPGIVKLFKRLPEDYSCDKCNGYKEECIGPFEPRNIWHIAHEIDPYATEYFKLQSIPQKNRVYGWCHLLNAYAMGCVEIKDKDTKKVADKFLLGYEPGCDGPRRKLGYEYDDLEVVAQRYPKGDNPYHVFTGFSYEPPDGIKLTYKNPLQIYPAGQYGGYYSVYISEKDRIWQKSQIIKRVAEQATSSKDYVPLAPCLWFLIHHGDLEILTRIIQEWMPFSSKIRKRTRENPVPKRCLNRKNWLALVCVGEIIRQEQDSLECMWLLIHNFVMVYETPPLIEGKKLDGIDLDLFWAESLNNLPSGVSDCFNMETNNKKVTDPSEIFRREKWRNTGKEIIHHNKVDSGELINELWHCFYVAEARLHGIEAKSSDYPQPFEDDIEVTWGGKVNKLDDLIIISREPIDHRPVPDVVRKSPKVCKCPKISYQEQQMLLRIQQQREEARLERQNAVRHDNYYDQYKVMAEFEKSIL